MALSSCPPASLWAVWPGTTVTLATHWSAPQCASVWPTDPTPSSSTAGPARRPHANVRCVKSSK